MNLPAKVNHQLVVAAVHEFLDNPDWQARIAEYGWNILFKGESTLLAGLLRDEQRKILTGFPGITKTPILRSLFGSTSDEINQSDIVMLLTPHIVRTHELTVEDLSSIYIGTQQNVGLGGPPPLIAPHARQRELPKSDVSVDRGEH